MIISLTGYSEGLMFNSFLKITAFIFLLTNLMFSQSISSTTAGGHWNSASTWVGGNIPGVNNDVIINGPVVCDTRIVNNLTVNQSGSLEDECCSGRNITVNGNLLNLGTIKNVYGGLNIYVKGNVTNNGVMTQSGLCFAGSGDQQISGTAKLSVNNMWKYPDGKIIAAQNLIIDSVTTVDLNGDILVMGAYKLTKLPNKIIHTYFTGGVINSNGQIDISGVAVMYSNLSGNFTLVGNNVMEFGNITVENNLHVGPGKIIQDECCAGRSITVKGDVINDGTIRTGYGGLTIYAQKNVINNGNMLQSGLCFSGAGDQQISGTKLFSPANIWKNPDGKIYAASNIIIDSVTIVDLNNDVLDMGSYKLTKLTNKIIHKYFTNGTIHSNGDIDISGVGVMYSNLSGNFTLVGNNVMEFGNITVLNNFHVGPGKIIQDECCAGRSITVHGDVINDGTIRNGYGGLTIYVWNNVINNGKMEQSGLCFNGSGIQQISGGKMFSPGKIWKDPSGTIMAKSDLLIDSLTTVDLSRDTLNMGSLKLAKVTNKVISSHFTGGIIISNGEIDVSGISIMYSNLGGNPILTGKNIMEFGNIEVFGNLTISPEKIIQDECCAGRRITIHGNLNNFGTIKNGYGGLGIITYGNIFNGGSITNNYVSQRTEGQTRTISGIFDAATNFEYTGTPLSGKIEIDGSARFNKPILVNKSGLELIVAEGSALYSYGGAGNSYGAGISNYGNIINKGIFHTTVGIHYSGKVYLDPGMNIDLKLLDWPEVTNVNVTTYNFVHPRMKTSVKRWWKINSDGNIKGYKIILNYDDDLLNGQNEDLLKVFLSTDNGDTWNLISNPLNTVLDKVNNTISVGSDQSPITEGVGDIIISTGGTIAIPSLSLAVGGRKQIRVGPPNRYTVSYWNNDNFTSDYTVVELKTNRGVHIMKVITKSIDTGESVEIPIDSLTYDGVNNEVYLVAQPLQPGEVRTFDVVLGAVPDVKKASSVMLEPITFTAALLWVGGAILEDYVSNVVVEGCYEMWRPVRHDEALMDASTKALTNSMKKAATFENGGKAIGKKAAEEIIKKTGHAAAWPVFLAKDIFDCMGNTFRGITDYLNGNFDKAEKGLEKVTSWDPNAKEGPAGFGSNGYMATSAPMNYTIYFENKKEATAPAWKIVILDTLDENVFDLSTVKFGKMSHNMGTASITGNILRWEFVEIELPPNVTPPEGEGWVQFTVHPKQGLPTGTEIKNKAVITFDLNPPIATNVSLNTLDFDSPTTTPISLNQIGNKLEFVWNADDGSGSGIKKSMVYISTGGGPYDLAGIADADRLIIDIVPERQYKLYVLSEDNVGNGEKEPSQIVDIITGMEKEEKILPTEYKLFQNHPNPFNPSTTIYYWIPKDGNVELEIYNILGEKLMTVVNQFQKMGSYNKTVNLNNFASGVYIYSLKVNSFKSVKKMMLVK